MEVDAILCNHAEAVNNQLFISAGGIDQALVAPGAPTPYGVNVALGLIIAVPWTATNQQHQLVAELVHEDGQAVQVPTGPGAESPFRMELAFNVGRPPVLTAGDDQHVALAFNMPGLPLPALGKYEFKVSVDGTPMKHLPFRLTLQPGGQVQTGPISPGAGRTV